MGKITGIAKLEEMKLMSGGNPNKIAQYKLEERVYNDTIADLFDDENPFMNRPDENYLTKLEEAAKDGDEKAVKRHEIAKERAKHFDFKRNDEQKVNNATKAQLLRKLEDGKATKDDVTLAEKHARMFSNSENIALYTNIKRLAEENEQ